MLLQLEKVPGKKTVLMLLLLFIPLFLFYLPVPSLWDEDESIYAEISRQMILRQDLVGTYFNYEPRYDKPPLNFWINIFFYKIFGQTEFATRLGSTIFGFLTLLLIYLIGKKLFNKRSAIMAVLILGTSFLFFIESQLALIDTTLTFFIALTVYWFYLGYFEHRLKFLIMLGIPLGLGILAKGPVAFLLSGAIAFCFWLYQTIKKGQPWQDLFNRRLLLGLFVAGVICLPWYWWMWSKYGNAFIASHFGYHMLDRFTKPLEHHGGAWYYSFYYLIMLIIGFLPWSGNLITAVWGAGRRWREPKYFLLLTWAVLVFIFFSLAQTKLPGYILPLFPPLALILGSWWDEILVKQEHSRFDWGSIIQVVVALGFAALIFTQREQLPIAYRNSAKVLLLMPLILIIGALIGLISYKRSKNYSSKFKASFFTFYLFWALFLLLLVPIAETYKPVKYLAQSLHPYLQPRDQVVSFIPGSKAAPFYTKHPVTYVTNNENLASIWKGKTRTFAMVREKTLTYLKQEQIPFYQIAKHGPGYLISNRPVR